MMPSADQWINKLGLQPHPEGGFFREVFRSAASCGDRSLSTSIYYLLKSGQVSLFHSLPSDEAWYFHSGSALLIHRFLPGGRYDTVLLANDGEMNHVPQSILPAGTIFGAEVEEAGSYSLVSCMVCPGFDFRDFALHERKELTERFPEQDCIIRRLTQT